MKKLLLSACLTACILGVNAQNTTPTEREPSPNTRPARTEIDDVSKTRVPREVKIIDYYIAFEVIQLPDSSLKFTLEKGTTPEPPRQFAADLSKLNRIVEGRMKLSHELDLINSLSLMGWEVVSMVEAIVPQERSKRQLNIYFKKTYKE